MNSIYALTLICFISSTALFAESKAEKRLKHQEDRIQSGLESGSINEKEAQSLENGQAKVEKALSEAQEDGDVSKREKRHINMMQKNQSHKIRRAKRN